MIDFMIIALPRSGTTWAANWLTTDRTFCMHDPLNTLHYREWDASPRFPRGRAAGVSCTGIRHWPEWIARHPARKLVLHRDVGEIAESLRRLGADPEAYSLDATVLDGVEGMHAEWDALFDPGTAAAIWHFLTNGLEFNAARHRELAQMNVQVAFDRLARDARVQVALERDFG